MIDQNAAVEFLSLPRLAVVGASDDQHNFGRTIYLELRSCHRAVVAVNPKATTVAGDPCYPDLASVPGDIDGAIVMVGPETALEVIRACADRGVPRVWLFKGLGGAGATSDDAVRLCDELGLSVVAGACPLMFLEPVGWFHRLHRSMRHLNGSLVVRSEAA